jgi:3-oxoacyl-[acyl-carrier protein] reductase
VTGVALVTGGGGRLGAALALALARDGFAVAIHFRSSADAATRASQSIREAGGVAETFDADLATERGAVSLAQRVADRFGTLDVLINNAGAFRDRPGLELSEAEWFEGLDSTVTQTFFTTRACLPLLRRGARKRIVNVGESSADRPGARDAAWSYHVGKTGVWILTRSLALAEARNGIAVNMVSPGLMEGSAGAQSAARVPGGRLGTADDVYAAVRFLVLEAPAYLTGSNLVLSGGWNLR